MKFLPIFLDLENKPVIVCGGGQAAHAKVRTLLKTRARITLYADDPLHSGLAALAAAGTLVREHAAPGDVALSAAALVYLAEQCPVRGRALAARCRRLGVLVNSADDRASSDFISAAIVDRDPVVVAIGSEGTAPVLVRRIKATIEALLPVDMGSLARLAAALRPMLRALL